jgi:preprotein translocase subunit SecD
MSTAAKKLVLILLLTAVCIFISLPQNIPINIHLGGIKIENTIKRPDLNINIGTVHIHKDFNLVLGLDLAGGSHLVFEADLSGISAEKRETALNGVKNVIERRVNLFGVSEPNIQASSFEGKERINVELPGVNNTKEAVDLIGKVAFLTFAEVEGEGDSQTLAPTDLTGADLKSADVVYDNTTGKPAVSLEFTAEGAKKFEDLTDKNIGKPLPILLDQEVVSAPVVQEKISGGKAQITGNFTVDEAKNLAIQLNAGALPVPVKLVEQRTVGATLGSESISASVQAGLVGLLMVLVFMVLSYGKLGLVADVALVIFGVITLALYKLIPVVLTLPGIAGFLLSVGMAVDSNILIFERFKEERGKRPLYDALEVSFGRAWDSIRDANIATLVTAFVLWNPLDFSFLHTSGPVRGFAITLTMGILISLFTGIVVSRNLLRVFVKK